MNLKLLLSSMILSITAIPAVVQAPAQAPRMEGVYKLIENPVELPRGMKDIGSPAGLPLTTRAKQIESRTKPSDDSAKLCLPVGPFRMMAWKDNVIDLYQMSDRVIMLFQDLYFGHMRTIYFDGRPHVATPDLWEGDSIAHWDYNTLVVDTVNLNSNEWLNDTGAPHSDALRLTERYRFLQNGKFIELSVTATDPQMLLHPYTYVRYYEKTAAEVQERVCWEDTEPVGR